MSLQDLIQSNNPAPSWTNLKMKSLIAEDIFASNDIAILGDLAIDGDLIVSGTGLIEGATTINDTLTVNGIITATQVNTTEDIYCRVLNASEDVNVTEGLTVTGEAVFADMNVDGLGKFNGDCQAILGVTIGNSLNASHNLSVYHTLTETGPLDNTLKAGRMTYVRIGPSVTISLYEASGLFQGFDSASSFPIKALTSEFPTITAQISSDLAGKTVYTKCAMKTAGGLYEPATVKFNPGGEIDMYEDDSTGIVSAGDTILNWCCTYTI